jgi:hypothetical protein
MPTPREQLRVATQGEPYGLRLERGAMSFCDRRGAWKVDLGTGTQARSDRVCIEDQEPNTTCEVTGLKVTVRTPGLGPDDVVEVDGVAKSFHVPGHVHDCAGDGRSLAIVTGSAVLRVDPAKETMEVLSDEGGERVVVGSGWIVWSNPSSMQAKRL